jgi:hypothetical protein
MSPVRVGDDPTGGDGERYAADYGLMGGPGTRASPQWSD